MIHNLDFSKRLQTVIDYYQLSATAFAEKINVQRSSISHLLSGRNRPSLDFVMKVLDQFKEVELYWLLNGKGVFPKPEENAIGTTLSKPRTNKIIPMSDDKEIDKIIIFYKDGTFKSYHEKE